MADTNKSAPFRREGADLLPRPGGRTRNGSDKFLPPTLGSYHRDVQSVSAQAQ